MTEDRAWPERVVGGHRLPGHLPQRQHDHRPAQQGQLAVEIRRARRALRRGRLVGRRRAVHGRGDVGAGQPQAVVPRRAGRLRGEARPVEGGEEPVTGPVPGEHPPGAVGAVRGGRQPDQHQRCLRVAEARDAATPVHLTGVGGPTGAGDLFAPAHQPRTAPADRHVLLHCGHRVPLATVGRHGAEPTMDDRVPDRPFHFRTPAGPARPQGSSRHRRAAGPPRRDPHHRQDAPRAGPGTAPLGEGT